MTNCAALWIARLLVSDDDPGPVCRLLSMHLKKFKSGGGESTFLLEPDDALLPELEPARLFIERLRKEKEVILDGWHYRISKERFLNSGVQMYFQTNE